MKQSSCIHQNHQHIIQKYDSSHELYRRTFGLLSQIAPLDTQSPNARQNHHFTKIPDLTAASAKLPPLRNLKQVQNSTALALHIKIQETDGKYLTQPTNQPTNQPINKPTTQPTTDRTNRPVEPSGFATAVTTLETGLTRGPCSSLFGGGRD